MFFLLIKKKSLPALHTLGMGYFDLMLSKGIKKGIHCTILKSIKKKDNVFFFNCCTVFYLFKHFFFIYKEVKIKMKQIKKVYLIKNPTQEIKIMPSKRKEIAT